MAITNIQTKIIMRNDTLQNWETHNPILAAGEFGIAIDSRTGICTIKVGDGIHHWKDLTLKLGERSYTSAYDSKGNELCRWYDYSSAIDSLSKIVAQTGVSAQQASEAIRNIMSAMGGNQTLTKVAEYVEEARPQPKNLRSELKTLNQDREFNITEVHSDIIVHSDAEFDF